MSKLFENSSINGMTLKNRFVRAATWEGPGFEGKGICCVTREMKEGRVSGQDMSNRFS